MPDVDWGAIQAMVNAGYVANPDGTITPPAATGPLFSPDQQALVNATARAALGPTPAPPPASQPASGLDWAAIQKLVDQGYKANPDGTITSPSGQVLAGSTGGAWNTPVHATPQQQTPAQQTQSSADASSAAMLLHQYGLDELIPIVDKWIRGGMTLQEAQLALYDRSTDAGKIFAARFPAIQMRQQKGLAPLSPAQYVAFEEQAQQTMRASGLPAGFYDSKDDFTNLLANDVSIPELQSRITDGYVAASQAPPDVKAELAAYYGVDEGHLAAHFLDPNLALPLIQKQVASAKLGAASSRVGLNFGVGESEHLFDAGVSEAQAAPLFAKVAGQMPLLGDLQKRFNDPSDPLTASDYTNALVIQDPQQLQHVARLLAQNQSAFSPSALFAADRNTGGIPGVSVQ